MEHSTHVCSDPPQFYEILLFDAETHLIGDLVARLIKYNEKHVIFACI